MELARETPQANVIREWEHGRLRIGENWFEGNLIISVDRIITDWPVDAPEQVDFASLQPAIDFAPEIILLGTGLKRLLPDVDLMASLAAEGIGLETMDTPAACRTFNVLLHEQRRVVAVLFNTIPAGDERP
jgi:uncharacterized protein